MALFVELVFDWNPSCGVALLTEILHSLDRQIQGLYLKIGHDSAFSCIPPDFIIRSDHTVSHFDAHNLRS